MTAEAKPHESLERRIDEMFGQASPDTNAARKAVDELLGLLESGAVRAAERDADGDWHAVTWVKRGILLGFRAGRIVDMSLSSSVVGAAHFSFFDKDTYPARVFDLGDGVRIVPGGTSIRRGAFVARGAVCMPPSYINIGAYVGPGSMIDSHALVGSCAQVGARVHISAGAQIGGVIEPVGAMPVIIEDDVLVGGNTGIYEGAIVKTRAVIAAGTILTASTPVYDLVKGIVIKPADDRPLIIPPGAVVVPGSRAVSDDKGRGWGLSLSTPVIVKYRDSRTDTRTELESWIR